MMNKEKIISLSLAGAIGLGSCMPAMAMQASDVPAGRNSLGSSLGSSQTSEENNVEVLSEADDKTTYATHEEIDEDLRRRHKEIDETLKSKCDEAERRLVKICIECKNNDLKIEKAKELYVQQIKEFSKTNVRAAEKFGDIGVDKDFIENAVFKPAFEVFNTECNKALKIQEEIDNAKKEALNGVTDQAIIEEINQKFEIQRSGKLLYIYLTMGDAVARTALKIHEIQIEELKKVDKAVEKAKEEAEEATKAVNAIADQAHKALDEKLKKEDKVLENLYYKTAQISNKIKAIREEELNLKFDKTRDILRKKEEMKKKEINQKWDKMRKERDEEFKRNQDEIEKSSQEKHKKIDEDLKKTPEEKQKAHYETYEKIEAQLRTLREETDEKLERINNARQRELKALEEANLRMLHDVDDTRLEIEKDCTEKGDKVVKAFEEVERIFKEEPEKKLEAIENFEKVFAEVEKEMNARIQKTQEIKDILKEIESLIKKFMAYIKIKPSDDKLHNACFNMFKNEFDESFSELCENFYSKLETQPEVYEILYRLFCPELQKLAVKSDIHVTYLEFELAFAEFAELFMEHFEETESNNVLLEITHQEYNKQCINKIKSQIEKELEQYQPPKKFF